MEPSLIARTSEEVFVLGEPGRNASLQAINGHCVKCGYRLALDRDSREARPCAGIGT